MSTAIWGESETQSDENYPLSLLKNLLQQMMEQFTAQGACLALYDENIRQMVIRLHLRTHISSPSSAANIAYCPTLEGQPVSWLWMLAIAAAT